MYSREIYKEKVENNGINVWSLFEFIFYKWKLVTGISVILFIAGMLVLLFTYKNNDANIAANTTTDTNTSTNTTVVFPDIQSHKTDQLTKSQQYKVDTILKLYEELKKLEDYKNNSSYMNLNAYECNSTVLQYLITDVDPDKDSFDIYKMFAKDGKLKEKIESEFGDEVVRPSDLLIISEGSRSSTLVPKTKNDVLNVKIVTADADLNKRITSTVKEAFNEYHQHILSAIGEHKISLLDENSYIGVDKTVETDQSTFEIQLDRNRSQIITLENQLTGEEKEVLDQKRNNTDSVTEKEVLDQEKDNTDNVTEVVPEEKIFPWQWSIVILVLCVIVSIVIVSCFYILNGRIKCSDEIVSLFGIPYIGKLVLKTDELKDEFLESRIELLCRKIGKKCIYLSPVGSKLCSMESYMDLMKVDLKEKDIDIIAGTNIDENPNDLKVAQECGNIVLIFGVNITSYSSIDRFLQQCDTFGINVAGAIDIRS